MQQIKLSFHTPATTDPSANSPSVEQRVDEDISEFEAWFCQTIDPSSPRLSNPERAILKTYLAYKLGVYRGSSG